MPLQLNLAMTPSEIATASASVEKISWMACHFSPDGKGLTDLPQQLPKDSMLILNDSIPWCGQKGNDIVDSLSRFISQFRCSSLLMDFQRPRSEEVFRIVEEVTTALPCPVAVTPEYAKDLSCPVFLPPAPLHIPLEKHLNHWKKHEIWLEVALCREQIIVTKENTQYKQDIEISPSIGHFSDKLCCCYKTSIKQDRIIFTLFDTPQTLQKKLDLAQSYGISTAVGLYQELGTFLSGRYISNCSIV